MVFFYRCFLTKCMFPGNGSLSTYAKFTEKLAFQPWPDQGVRNNSFHVSFACVINGWSRLVLTVSADHTILFHCIILFFRDRKWLVDFSTGKSQLISFDRSNNTGSIDVKMDGSVLEEKSSFKMLRLPFFSKSEWESYIISIARTASKKMAALIFLKCS